MFKNFNILHYSNFVLIRDIYLINKSYIVIVQQFLKFVMHLCVLYFFEIIIQASINKF